ncbi:hypothetical protein AAFF_G00341210 [Aldrovandia affinis]|uniref:Uncharacterized protein n=1 Tax=Aldrovandia affinis TaxID=143900 RepID=A0AAD7SKV5_9TELE|nr:hypothetical protein AAFF_G00341210 [Aldrovandia affinis]
MGIQCSQTGEGIKRSASSPAPFEMKIHPTRSPFLEHRLSLQVITGQRAPSAKAGAGERIRYAVSGFRGLALAQAEAQASQGQTVAIRQTTPPQTGSSREKCHRRGIIFSKRSTAQSRRQSLRMHYRGDTRKATLTTASSRIDVNDPRGCSFASRSPGGVARGRPVPSLSVPLRRLRRIFPAALAEAEGANGTGPTRSQRFGNAETTERLGPWDTKLRRGWGSNDGVYLQSHGAGTSSLPHAAARAGPCPPAARALKERGHRLPRSLVTPPPLPSTPHHFLKEPTFCFNLPFRAGLRVSFCTDPVE